MKLVGIKFYISIHDSVLASVNADIRKNVTALSDVEIANIISDVLSQQPINSNYPELLDDHYYFLKYLIECTVENEVETNDNLTSKNSQVIVIIDYKREVLPTNISKWDGSSCYDINDDKELTEGSIRISIEAKSNFNESLTTKGSFIIVEHDKILIDINSFECLYNVDVDNGVAHEVERGVDYSK